jgi:hypothetical protein
LGDAFSLQIVRFAYPREGGPLTLGASLTDVLLPFPEPWLKVLVDAVVEHLSAVDLAQPVWMTREQAAEYLSVPKSRLEKDKSVPAHRWDGRVLYNRPELDEWLLAQAV